MAKAKEEEKEEIGQISTNSINSLQTRLGDI